MIQCSRFPSALLAAPLFGLALGPALLPLADDLAFRPAADTELKKELKLVVELKPEKISFTVNGETMPPENLGGLGEDTVRVELEEIVRETIVQARDGRPIDLLRTFEELSLGFEAGEEKGDADGFDRLEGQTVRFRWNDETRAYERSFHESQGDEAFLEDLSEDMDLRALLPSGPVSEGDTWEVEGEALLPVLLPGGLPGRVAEGDEAELEPMFEELRAEVLDLLEDLKVRCKYYGSRDESGERVGEVHLEFSLRKSLDLSRLIEQMSEMEDSEIQPSVDATVEVELQGEGTLLWDLAGGHARSFRMRSEGGIDLDVKASADIEGETFEMAFTGHFATKAETSLDVSRP